MSNAAFTDLNDSPIFRARATELEQGLDRVKDRAQKLIKDAAKYCKSIEGQHTATLSFADSLETFCGGTDEESMLTGGPMLAKFVQTLRELASFHELLRTQVELLLCERLNHNWTTLSGEVRDAKKRTEKRTAELDAARLRHLGHKNVGHVSTWSKSDPDKSLSELLQARAVSDEARFELARKLGEVEGRKRVDFCEAVVCAMDAHVRFFERGRDASSSLEPYIDHSLQVIEGFKADAQSQQSALEAMIEQHRQAECARHEGLMSESPVHGASAGLLRAGPLQMTAGTSQLAAEMDLFIRHTQASGGAQVTVLKQGYLLKQSSSFRKEWKRRFFVLDSTGILYYYSAKERQGGRDKQPTNTVNLLMTTVKLPAPDELGVRYCFRIVSPEKEFFFAGGE